MPPLISLLLALNPHLRDHYSRGSSSSCIKRMSVRRARQTLSHLEPDLYDFEDEPGRCVISLPISKRVTVSDIEFKLKNHVLTLGVRPDLAIENEALWDKILVDECTWEIDHYNGQRCVVLELVKSKSGHWGNPFKSQVELKPQLGSSDLETIFMLRFDRTELLRLYEQAAKYNFLKIPPRTLIRETVTNIERVFRTHGEAMEKVETIVHDHDQYWFKFRFPLLLPEEEALIRNDVNIVLEANNFVAKAEASNFTFVALPNETYLTEKLLSHDPTRFATYVPRGFFKASEAHERDPAEQLMEDGAIFIPNALQRALGNEAFDSLHDDVMRWSERSSFQTPMPTHGLERTDTISFLDERSAMRLGLPGLSNATKFMKGVVHAFGRDLRRPLDLGVSAPQISIFEPGGFRSRHVDSDNSGYDGLTVVLYVNDVDWPEEAGGQMRFHDCPGSGQTLDVFPRGGTLAIFRSSQVEYEVIPPIGRKSVSLTLWAGNEDARVRMLETSNSWFWPRDKPLREILKRTPDL